MKNKIKALIVCGAAALTVLSGCAKDGAASASDTTGRTAAATTTTTAVTTAETTTSATAVTDETYDTYGETEVQGEYEAGKDGMVATDDAEDGGRVPPETTEITAQSGARVTDEAAFASSYMNADKGLDNKKIGWGLGKERDSSNRPVDAVKAREKYAELGAVFLPPEGKICLTFDEGYENGYTAAILDTLKEKGVKAVFFVTYDYCKSEPALVQRMIDEGHTVGNHTYSHPSMPDITQKQVWEEVTKLHDYVRDNFGYEMTLFRFPKGEFSERCLDDVKNMGYKSVFWSFAYYDWDPGAQPDRAEALAKIKASTHSGIYLLHAVSSVNADILPILLDFWKEQGYTVGAEI